MWVVTVEYEDRTGIGLFGPFASYADALAWANRKMTTVRSGSSRFSRRPRARTIRTIVKA